MSDSLSKPTYNGGYRIKVLDTDRYLEYAFGNRPFVKLAPFNDKNPRQVWRVNPNENGDTFAIASTHDDAGLVPTEVGDEDCFDGYGCPRPLVGQASANWVLKPAEEGGKQFTRILYENSAIDSCTPDEEQVHFFKISPENENQRFVFEEADLDGNRGGGFDEEVGEDKRAERSFEQTFFTFTLEQAQAYEYDIIIIGTGIGGGVVAADLFDTNSRLGKNAKHILVIERGGLVFHSHCLNTSRPSGFGADRGQQNDTFFSKFKKNYELTDKTNPLDVKAGTMYNIGGRSAAWGLFAPRIHDETLSKDFPSQVKNALLSSYYRQAEALMNLSLPTTRTVHQNLMERLNMSAVANVQWQWGRIASEFNEGRNFDFAEGAYSPIDKLLEIAMSKPKGDNGEEKEHDNFKILLRTEVRKVNWSGKTATGVSVRGPDGKDVDLHVKEGGTVVLAAGTVDSAAILLRSGKSACDVLEQNDGLHVTDHDIFARSGSFKYQNAEDRQNVGSMKLQTYTKAKRADKSEEVVLINMSIDASSFLPRTHSTIHDFPKWIIAFIRPAELNPKNFVKLENDEPVIQFNRNEPFSLSDPVLKELRNLTEEVETTLSSALNMTWIPKSFPDKSQFFKPLEMGGVAHELGTIPMKRTNDATKYCLDDRLKFRDHEGLYVCDLSVFASSPEVNPTLTLAALALRLSRETLLPWVLPNGDELEDEYAYVMNHSGLTIKVFLSNRSKEDISKERPDRVLRPGEYTKWKRSPKVIEAVHVFRLGYSQPNQFIKTPEFCPARASTITFVV